MFIITSFTLHGIINWTIAQTDSNGAEFDLFSGRACERRADLVALIDEMVADRAIDSGDEAALRAQLT